MSFYLPSELIPNILEVTECRCSTLHQRLQSMESRLLVKHRNEVKQQFYNLYLDNQTCDFVVGLDSQLVNRKRGNFGIVGSFNGLVCLTEFHNDNVNRALIFLWNPSIRKLFKLPKHRIDYPFPNRRINDPTRRIGFCYIPEIEDYKIVRVFGEDKQIDVEIYQLSTNSWHYVDVGDFAYDPWMSHIGGFLNGKLHWTAYALQTRKMIVSLDMKSEKFGSLMIPISLRDNIIGIHVYKESLCAIQHTEFFFNVWVMNEYGVADSWALQFKIDTGGYGVSAVQYVRGNGEFIYRDMHGYLVSFDATSKRITKIGGCEKKLDSEVASYMESLVLLKRPDRKSRRRRSYEDRLKLGV